MIIYNFFSRRANLSDNYFTNRQDRYVQFNNCPEICDFFSGLVKTVSRFSLSLHADNSTKLHAQWEIHPYQGTCMRRVLILLQDVFFRVRNPLKF